jgi:hypothetical protein
MDIKWDPEDLALRLENHGEYVAAANEIVMEEAARFIRKQQRLIGCLEYVVNCLEGEIKCSTFSEQQKKTRPDIRSANTFYDFELCAEYEELKASVHSINHLGYEIICATQDHRGVYTLFFRRPA